MMSALAAARSGEADDRYPSLLTIEIAALCRFSPCLTHCLKPKRIGAASWRENEADYPAIWNGVALRPYR